MKRCGYVRAEDVRDIAEGLHLSCDFMLEEAVAFEHGARALDIAVDVEHSGCRTAACRCHGRNQACAWNEERPHPIPVALLPCRT